MLEKWGASLCGCLDCIWKTWNASKTISQCSRPKVAFGPASVRYPHVTAAVMYSLLGGETKDEPPTPGLDQIFAFWKFAALNWNNNGSVSLSINKVTQWQEPFHLKCTTVLLVPADNAECFIKVFQNTDWVGPSSSEWYLSTGLSKRI